MSMAAAHGREASFLHHYAIHGLVWTNLVIAVLVFFPEIPFLVMLALYVVSFALILPWVQHARRMCAWCITTDPVLDGAEQAEREYTLLQTFHWFTASVRRMLWVVGGYVGLGLGLAVFDAPKAAQVGVVALWALVLATMWHVIRVHQRLESWCPACRGRGDHEVVEEPSPSLPHGTKS